ncbi:MAG: VanZ family protein [Rubritepida sp.]|nr:VanZ family protein [Rubritepida sp.]
MSGAGVPRQALWLALALVLGFILYGSLYPFGFTAPRAGLSVAFEAAMRPRPTASRGDVLANLVLYAPIGLLLGLLLPRRLGAVFVFAITLVASGALSLAIEATQAFVPGRSPSLWDVILNTVSGAAGGLAALLVRGADWRAPGLLGGVRREPFLALLLLGWLAYRLYPYVPSLDLQGWKDALKPLLLTPTLDPPRTFRLAVSWLVFAWMLARLVGAESARWIVPLVVLGTVAAAVPIVDRRLTLPEVVAAGLGLLGWVLLPRRGAVPVLLVLLLAAVAIERLHPFTFTAEGRAFSWIPFRSVIGGQRAQGQQAMLMKAFLYGGLLWLAVRAGLPLLLATLLGAGLLVAAGYAQTHLPGRSGEVTDAALLVLLAGLMWLLRPATPPAAAGEDAGGPARASPPPPPP